MKTIEINVNFHGERAEQLERLTRFSRRHHEVQTIVDGLKLLAVMEILIGSGYVKLTKEGGYRFILQNQKENEHCRIVEIEWDDLDLQKKVK